MSDEKISAMPAAALPLTGNELVPLVQGGDNVQTRTAAFATTPGGAANQIQFNNGGLFGGFTMGGDATLVVGTGVLTIANNAVTTAKINNSAVTLAKIANAAANSKLLGSGAAGVGAAYSEITLGTNLSFTGTTLNAAATGLNQLTGDVTAGPGTGSQVATLANVGPGAGTTTLANVTIDAKGRVTAIASAQSQAHFVPNLAFGGASVGITYNNQSGTWIRIGNFVIVDLIINLSSKGSSVGAASITNLPHMVENFQDFIGTVRYIANFGATIVSGVCQASLNTTTLQLITNGAGSSNTVMDTDFTNTSIFRATISYIAQ